MQLAGSKEGGQVYTEHGSGAKMESPVKLFSWKRATVVIVVGIGAVSYRTCKSYHRKGHLDLVDLWVAAITIAIILCIVALVGWWANRPE